ncbi:uncharacterized protein Fot_02650 [Forsythia ovata]|uniref:B3 domain-containing protein n=1 Tax=Forsythia ovata TaxID=205694 RepID=A0ABD1X7F5_9LAMI
MITNTVNLPSGDEFSPSPRSSYVKNHCACSVPSQTIKLFGVMISVSNKKEKEHILEINQNDCTGTNILASNRKRKAIEFVDYLSRENNTTNIVASSSRVDQEFNSDQTSLDLELRLWSPSIIRRRIMDRQDPIIMGGEIVPYVQPQNRIIMEAEIIQQVQAQAEDLADHWRIKKVLKISDVDSSSRLLIGRKQVFKHIIPFFTNNPSEFCQNIEGIRVTVFDVDTLTEHMLTLKKWKTNSFVLFNNWMKNFVSRRQLKVNDEIGLRWDVNASRLEFTVLERHQN